MSYRSMEMNLEKNEPKFSLMEKIVMSHNPIVKIASYPALVMKVILDSLLRYKGQIFYLILAAGAFYCNYRILFWFADSNFHKVHPGDRIFGAILFGAVFLVLEVLGFCKLVDAFENKKAEIISNINRKLDR